jgi:hypothetical protein
MDDARRAFYQYHSCLMEPWDGPGAIAFTDGKQIGAILDRNGLRPSRYYVTKDGLVVMASEAGVLDFPPEDILRKGRLQPGRMFLVDTAQGRIIEDEEIKRADRRRAALPAVAQRAPGAPRGPARGAFRARARPRDAAAAPDRLRLHLRGRAHPDHPDGARRRRGHRLDGQRHARSRRSPTSRACSTTTSSSSSPRSPIRRSTASARRSSLRRRRGSAPRATCSTRSPADCRRVELKWPVLTNEEFAKIRRLDLPGLKTGVLPIAVPRRPRREGPRQVDGGDLHDGPAHDRGGGDQHPHPQRPRRQPRLRAHPALLAVAGLHHYLIREGLRTRVSLVLETGEAREVHHFALLIGYGASAINPYVAFETIDDMIREGLLTASTTRPPARTS